jgi:DNA polymerase-3 subunit alpha
MINFRTFCKYAIKHSIADLDFIADKAKEDSDKYVAILDKENLHSTIFLAEECKKRDLLPIIGYEIDENSSVWPTTHKALRNINMLSTIMSKGDGANVTKEQMQDCVKLIHHTDNLALAIALESFEQSNICIEIREHDDDKRKLELEQFANLYNLKIIPTSDVLYNERKNALAHDYFHNYVHKDGQHLLVDTYYVKTLEDFKTWAKPEWIQNAYDLSKRFNIDIQLGKIRLPEYDRAPNGMSNFDYLEKLCREQLHERRLTSGWVGNDAYEERLAHELEDIKNAKLESYFLIVKDICDWARSNGIKKGRGRGSGAGSLVCYLTDITGINPIKYGLIWERFYNAGRAGSLPDIDTDFEKDRREEVIKYISDRWGEESVFQIITFGSFGPAKAITVVLNIGQCSFEEQKKVAKLVHHKATSIKDALTKSKELAEEAKRRGPLFKIAEDIEGAYESFGKHAAGVIISNEPFTNGGLPMTWHIDDERYISGYDLYAIESYGLLKIDVLGLNTLNIIKRAEELIRKRHNKDFKIEYIPLDDKDVYENILHKGLTKGIFQLESQLGQKYSELVKPNSILEIADLITLVRPGAMEPGQTQQYLDVRWGRKAEEYPHPKLKSILGDTYSSCIYQEQVMFICTDVAGLDLKTADNVRRAAGKKKPELMAKQKDIFINGCKAQGVTDDVSATLWSWIVEFSGYGFNKSHAVSYAFLSYETAWLKHHYPLEFFEASCNHVVGDIHRSEHEKLRELIYDAKHFSIDIVLPSVKECNSQFEIIGPSKIRYGLSFIKGVGASSIPIIEKCNKEINFTAFLIKALQNKLRKDVLEALICGGALDCYGLTRNTMLAEYQLLNSLTDRELTAILKEVNGHSISDVIKLASDESNIDFRKSKSLIVPNKPRREKLRTILTEYRAKDKYESIIHIATYEREFLGCDISVNETDAIFSNITHTLADIKNIPDNRKVKVKTAIHIDKIRTTVTKKGKQPGQDMAFITGSDGSAILDSIVLFPKQYQIFKNILNEGRVIYIEGETSESGGLIVNNISILK